RWGLLWEGALETQELFGFEARPLQAAVEELVRGADGQALVLVEAPTGEGKTEAAYLASMALERAAGHRGMYIALPTRATGAAMYRRTLEFMRKTGGRQGLDLQLAQSGATLDPVFRGTIAMTEDSPRDSSVVAHEWFTYRKRALLSRYGVGTIDQALMSVLSVRHGPVRLWGLGNRTVVLDEVHAYDTYTSGLIERLIQWLAASGSSVVLMSATLPPSRRRRLVAAFGGRAEEGVPYPRATVATKRGCATIGFEASRPSVIDLSFCDGAVGALAALLLELVSPGGNACLVVNTVDRAQRVYALLRETWKGPREALTLFHARFPAEQRQRIEERLLTLYGPSGNRPERSVVVATQVVEQSLDVDFDYMISDIAPVDLVLQRAGRLHRHADNDRRRPDPRRVLHVCEPGNSGGVPDLIPAKYIYDEHILLRSFLALARRGSVVVPDDLEHLIEWVYESDEEPDGISEELAAALSRARVASTEWQREMILKAESATIPEPEAYADAPTPRLATDPDDDPMVSSRLAALTRLGEPSIPCVPLYEVDGRLFLDPDRVEQVELGRRPNREAGRRLLERSVSVSRKDVRAYLLDRGVPASWASTAALRGHFPLVLDRDGCCVAGRCRVRLDGELGLVYETDARRSSGG
ncbi:CRISPR-associated helicase Cas3', partial [Candidatus Fermentibacterales bacterium]|nr:CRISPR-associated helicase Cas3' [Candidatus Fermentibacterales bacterium]